LEKQRKILLVHLFSNGDCLFATTVARQIKKDYPGCHLTWAIAGFCKSIIANNPYVDEIMEVNSVAKNDVVALRKFKKEIAQRKINGEFDDVFITLNMDTNQALYDGCIRSGIFGAYTNPITVPVQPVLRLSEAEINSTRVFSEQHNLSIYKQVILFEFAPLSGQSAITREIAVRIAEKLCENKDIAVILSSGNKIEHPYKNLIDGSVLSLRETAALTHYCSMLVGCSSGITWISTSDGAKQLPMIQIINPDTDWVNPVSRDFERFGLDISEIIELTHLNESELVNCIRIAAADFNAARAKYNEKIPLHFRTTRNIVYNLLCYFELAAIWTHIRINKQVYGNRVSFYYEVIMGLITSPFKLIRNIFRKRILKR
jgi:ADP-heptose:LPS heptosyltransferase